MFSDNFVIETQRFVHLKRIINLPKLIYANKAIEMPSAAVCWLAPVPAKICHGSSLTDFA